MSAALGLYRLQQVDSQMDQAQSRLRVIRQTLENDAELRAAIEAHAAAETQFKNTERLLKQSEQDVEKQRLKIQQTESSLYSGLVHNPKELQDLQRDIVSLKKYLETLEERQLEAMLAAETAEDELKKSSTALESLQTARGTQFQGLTTESETIRKNIDNLSSERSAVMQDIGAQTVGIYDQLRRQKRGVAVTLLSDGSCGACGTTLSASQQQNARSASQLFYCPLCGRILYAD